MRSIGKLLFYVAGLLVVFVVQLGNGSKMVSELMMANVNDKSGLIKHFKDTLYRFCNFTILTDKELLEYENQSVVEPCLCTVIYNISKELELFNISITDVESAKNQANSSEFNDKTYEIWEYVSKISPSLKLFMKPLDVSKLKAICHNLIKDDVKLFCKFLNVEVLLLYNLSQTSKKLNIDKIPEKIKQPNISNGVLEEKEKPEAPHENIGIESPNKELDVEDAQNPKEEDSNDEEPTDATLKNDNNMGQEKQTIRKEIDTEIATVSKIDSQSNNDYPKEDDSIVAHTENKENRLKLSQNNRFSNHEFSDTEDSHFLFYFGVMTILSMIFYLALYNKKKIVALLIEGRRSTNHRRRPNSASYSKVETDDASTVF